MERHRSLGQSREFERAPGTNLIASIKGTSIHAATPVGNIAFTYDTSGNRTSVTNALGNKISYTYDPTSNKVTSVTDPLGNVTASDYDAKGNLKTIKDPNGHTMTFTYDSFGELTAIEDALKNVTTLDYDFGNLTAITDPLGNKTHIAFDPDSRPIQVTDALGRTSSHNLRQLKPHRQPDECSERCYEVHLRQSWRSSFLDGCQRQPDHLHVRQNESPLDQDRSTGTFGLAAIRFQFADT